MNNGFKLISALLRGKWLIDEAWANSHLLLVDALLEGKPVLLDDRYAGGVDEAPKTVLINVAGRTVVKTRSYTNFNDVPEGSISMISIAGPITKYGNCSLGSVDYADMINRANASPNISSILLKIDSPGGQVDGTATLADAIKNASKPVIAVIDDGMMASAAMWIGSAADEIYAMQKTDTAGSIGVYTTLADFTKSYEARGIVLHEIYSDRSPDKNKDHRDALKGKYEAVKDDLNFIADQFISVIKENRSGKLNLKHDNPFTGKMYVAEEAIKVGLIDGISTIEAVVDRLDELKNKQISNSNENMSGFKKISALKNIKAEQVLEEQLQEANAELQEEGINAVLISATAYEEYSKAGKESDDKTKDLTEKLAAANVRIKELENKPAEPVGGTPKDSKSEITTPETKDDFVTEYDLEIQALKGK